MVYICCPHCGYWYSFRRSDLLETFPDGTFACVWCWKEINWVKKGFSYSWKD